MTCWRKDKATLPFDTLSFPNNCLFTQKVVYQRQEFTTQREFQLIFKSPSTCRFLVERHISVNLPEALNKHIWEIKLIHLISQLEYLRFLLTDPTPILLYLVSIQVSLSLKLKMS